MTCPLVLVRSRGHEHLNSQITQEALDEFWQRLSDPIKTILTYAQEDHQEQADITVLLMHPDESVYATFDEVEDDNGNERFQIAIDYSISKVRLLWVLAHELAHLYLRRIGRLASRSDDDFRMSRALDVLTGHTDDLTVHIINEHMADTLAISWGFGREYALSEGANILEAKEREDYINCEIAEMYRTLKSLESNHNNGI